MKEFAPWKTPYPRPKKDWREREREKLRRSLPFAALVAAALLGWLVWILVAPLGPRSPVIRPTWPIPAFALAATLGNVALALIRLRYWDRR